MMAYWQDGSDIVASSNPQQLGLVDALNRWADGHAVQGNFFGLIDENNCTIQFYFVDGIPDHIEDARHLRIVLVDFPVPARQGSFSTLVTIGDSSNWIEKAFLVGANHENFEGLEFSPWE